MVVICGEEIIRLVKLKHGFSTVIHYSDLTTTVFFCLLMFGLKSAYCYALFDKTLYNVLSGVKLFSIMILIMIY